MTLSALYLSIASLAYSEGDFSSSGGVPICSSGGYYINGWLSSSASLYCASLLCLSSPIAYKLVLVVAIARLISNNNIIINL